MWRKYFAIAIVSILVTSLVTKIEANPVNMPSSDVPTESTTSSILDNNASTTVAPKCIVNLQPCGWGVFSKNRRKVDYFIKNTCKCASPQKCLLDGEDLSLGAYVYRCKEQSKPSTA